MASRRQVLQLGVLTGLVLPAALRAQQRRSLADPLRLGVDHALVASGLAAALQKGFGRDTGVAVKLVAGPALPLLEALERGEMDAALANAPQAEARLESQGLVHDRREVATGEFVIVGPAPRAGSSELAGLAAGHDGATVLQRLREAALAAPGDVRFLSAGDGSGTHMAEQALWRLARIAPLPPWYLSAEPGRGLIAQAREQNAYALVERGAWLRHRGAPLALWVEGDPRLVEAVHVMRSFRVNHPAARMFVAWITGPKGRRVVAAQRGYRITRA